MNIYPALLRAAQPTALRLAGWDAFDEIWIVDFEFAVTPGGLPHPVCCVARELYSRRTHRLWQHELARLERAPWNTGPRAVTVAYFSSAEISCFRVLDWPDPTHVIDLFAEFRVETNGLRLPAGRSLLGALAYYGLSGMTAGEKQSMRDLVLRGGPWTDAERRAVIDYCEEDVASTELLLHAMHARLGR
jgi:DNA polymerase-1